MRRSFTIALSTVAFSFVAVALWATDLKRPTTEGKLTSVFQWQLPHGWFGGFSGLELSEDGKQMVAISDRGVFVEGNILRKNGEIIAVQDIRQTRVLRPNGKFPKRSAKRDSEGLAFLPKGAVAVSFEGDHRLERFSQPGVPGQKMPFSESFQSMEPNGGFEALAVDRAGTFFAMPEEPIGATDKIHVFALKNGSWSTAFTLTRDKQFQPVGADFGPDDRLYVLERGFNGFGFRTRVRSFAIHDSAASDEKVLFSKGIGIHDNLEGLAVWRDQQGLIRLTMISDDNFRLIQRTEIVEYAVTQ